ncbi:unannotated protein [freshwater metagenome]|uniref:Unannotated protein n=1 Tax=freshwater metagenome TaxID=449393 RepID=A0A6J7E2S6_9ZZZZ|nr:SDR family oxidoreductase [Actinomycetota bacterium]
MRRLEGKVAIITGGAQGIGEGCAHRMAAEGAKVVIADRQEDTGVAAAIEAAGGVASHYVMDVRLREDWNALVADTVERHGGVDLLGNVAGVVNTISPDTVVGLTDEGWDYVIDTDLKGVWLGMQAVIPQMQQRGGGRIVNISSLSALRANLENLAAYCAAKRGVIGLSQQAALTYAPDNILINSICPGTTDTPILQDIGDEAREMCANAHMIKRLGQPRDIAAMMATCFSEDGDFLTGQTISVDGGWVVNGRNF